MASREQRESAQFTRDDIDQQARNLGHTMTWQLGPGSNRKGNAYYFVSECDHCGARATAGPTWSSCDGIRDARRETCSGPGTKVLTEIEHQRSLELLGEAVAEFGAQVQQNLRDIGEA